MKLHVYECSSSVSQFKIMRVSGDQTLRLGYFSEIKVEKINFENYSNRQNHENTVHKFLKVFLRRRFRILWRKFWDPDKKFVGKVKSMEATVHTSLSKYKCIDYLFMVTKYHTRLLWHFAHFITFQNVQPYHTVIPQYTCLN